MISVQRNHVSGFCDLRYREVKFIRNMDGFEYDYGMVRMVRMWLCCRCRVRIGILLGTSYKAVCLVAQGRRRVSHQHTNYSYYSFIHSSFIPHSFLILLITSSRPRRVSLAPPAPSKPSPHPTRPDCSTAHHSYPNKPIPEVQLQPHPYTPRRHDLDSAGDIRLPTAPERIPAHPFPETTTHLVVRPCC
jgi:hypothetical protein